MDTLFLREKYYAEFRHLPDEAPARSPNLGENVIPNYFEGSLNYRDWSISLGINRNFGITTTISAYKWGLNAACDSGILALWQFDKLEVIDGTIVKNPEGDSDVYIFVNYSCNHGSHYDSKAKALFWYYRKLEKLCQQRPVRLIPF